MSRPPSEDAEASLPEDRREPRRFDPERVLGFAGRDPAFIRELAGVLRQSAGRQLTNLRRALAAGDRSGFARHAHQLRGGLGTFGDAPTDARAAALEEASSGASASPDAALAAQLDGVEADIRWLGGALLALADEMETA